MTTTTSVTERATATELTLTNHDNDKRWQWKQTMAIIANNNNNNKMAKQQWLTKADLSVEPFLSLQRAGLNSSWQDSPCSIITWLWFSFWRWLIALSQERTTVRETACRFTVKSHIFVWYLLLYIRTFEKCAKLVIVWTLLFVFVLRKKRSKTKERMKEEEMEKGDCGPTKSQKKNYFLCWDPWFSMSFCLRALESTKFSSYELVSSQKYENGYRT